jgi:hypothetical protein
MARRSDVANAFLSVRKQAIGLRYLDRVSVGNSGPRVGHAWHKVALSAGYQLRGDKCGISGSARHRIVPSVGRSAYGFVASGRIQAEVQRMRACGGVRSFVNHEKRFPWRLDIGWFGCERCRVPHLGQVARSAVEIR